jgi:hypothetical protein
MEAKRKQIRIIWTALGINLKIDFKTTTIQEYITNVKKISLHSRI